MLGQLNGGLASLVLTASKVDSGVILPGYGHDYKQI